MTEEQRLRANARSYLHVYVKRGHVTRGCCEVCGDEKVEAHHEDYTKPLDVRWLCKLHHLQAHGKQLDTPKEHQLSTWNNSSERVSEDPLRGGYAVETDLALPSSESS